MESRVPVCVYDLIGLFAFGCRYKRLKAELDVCDAMQRAIPPSFLKGNAWYRSGNWGFVNNPFRRGNAFLPITYMDFTDPWSHIPQLLCHMLCRKKVRDLKTYKGIFFRRVGKMAFWGPLGRGRGVPLPVGPDRTRGGGGRGARTRVRRRVTHAQHHSIVLGLRARLGIHGSFVC